MIQQLLKKGNNPGILQRYKIFVSNKLRILDTNDTQDLKKTHDMKRHLQLSLSSVNLAIIVKWRSNSMEKSTSFSDAILFKKNIK